MEKKLKSLFITNVLIFVFAAIILLAAFDFFISIGEKNGLFSDFNEVCNFALSKNPYTEYKTSYAPLVMVFVYPFAKMAHITTDANEILLKNTDYILSFILFNAALILSILIITFFLMKNKKLFPYVFFASVTGAPFVFCIIRGNTVMLSLVFILLFMLFKDSKSVLLREISLISLGIAGVLKIYPLFFGVYLLCKGKYRESVRVAIYFLAFLILPFLFFEGGLSNLSVYLDNVFRFAYLEKREYGYANMSLFSLICKLLDFIGMSKISVVASLIVSFAFLALSVNLAIRTKSDVVRSLVVLYTICLIPPVSYFYTLVFMLPCLIEISKGEREGDEIYVVLLGIISFLPLISFSIFMYHSIFLIVGLIYEIIVHNKEEKITNGGNYESSNIRRRIRNKNK